MIKKIIFTTLWTLVFFFGSVMLLGFLSGLLFGGLLSWGAEIEKDGTLVKVLGMSCKIVPMVLGPIGLLLGIFGKLPGTRFTPKDKES